MNRFTFQSPPTFESSRSSPVPSPPLRLHTDLWALSLYRVFSSSLKSSVLVLPDVLPLTPPFPEQPPDWSVNMGNRTRDPVARSRMYSQLSHEPVTCYTPDFFFTN